MKVLDFPYIAGQPPCQLFHAELDVEVFTRDFVRTGKPAMIRGLDEHPGCSTSSEAPWPARTKWAGAETFVQNRGDIPFRLTELAPLFGMGKPLPVRIPLGIFLGKLSSPFASIEQPLGLMTHHYVSGVG